MTYFVSSDVHGFFDQWMQALEEAGFDKNNPNHMIIHCGDLMDRGPQPINCLHFVNDMAAKNRAYLIRGNHEDLLEQAICHSVFGEHDYTNGTAWTVCALAGSVNFADEIFDKALKNEALNEYYSNLVDYVESDHYIFTHGWIPCNSSDSNMYHARGVKFNFDPNWRDGNWTHAHWINGMDAWQQGVKIPDKTIVCGHWHASWGHHYIEHKSLEFPNKYSTNPEHRKADFSPFIAEGIIALDACTAFSKQVNCIKLEEI